MDQVVTVEKKLSMEIIYLCLALHFSISFVWDFNQQYEILHFMKTQLAICLKFQFHFYFFSISKTISDSDISGYCVSVMLQQFSWLACYLRIYSQRTMIFLIMRLQLILPALWWIQRLLPLPQVTSDTVFWKMWMVSQKWRMFQVIQRMKSLYC